jgi:G3E family GTPase
MRLIVITGMRHAAKVELAQRLIQALSAQNVSLTLLDNSDEPIKLAAVTRQRLAGGCVCCSLAAALIPLVWRLETDYALLTVSSSADPEVLAFILSSLRSSRIQITTLALIDTLTQTRHPHLAHKLAFYSDHAVYEPFDVVEAVNAAVRVSM